MRWTDSFFLHWRVRPDALRPLVPDGLTLDTARSPGGEEVAYLSLVAVRVVGPAPGPLVRALGPLAYTQVNLRTYVTGPSGPGILLLDTQVDGAVAAVGGRLAGMPYHLDRALALEITGDEVAPELAIRARTFAVTGLVEAAPSHPAPPGSEAYFVLERYWAFGQRAGRVYGVRVAHHPWLVRDVRLTTPLPSAIFGYPPAGDGDGEPVLAHFAPGRVDVSVVELADERAAAYTSAPAAPEMA